jgi:hypothetical protein
MNVFTGPKCDEFSEYFLISAAGLSNLLVIMLPLDIVYGRYIYLDKL